jgi:hypothetical protein
LEIVKNLSARLPDEKFYGFSRKLQALQYPYECECLPVF